MRVALVTPSMFVGGGERWMLTLARYTPGIEWVGCGVVGLAPISLDSADEMASLMPLVTYRDQERPDKYGDVPNTSFADRKDLIRHLCGKLPDRADVLICWGVPWIASWLPSGWPGKLVLVSHGDDDWTANLFRWSGERADGLVAVSEAAKRPMGVHGNRAAVIHNGVELERIEPQYMRSVCRQNFGWQPHDVVIGYIGRLSSEKNCEGIAAAVYLLRKRPHGKRCKLWYIGDGMNAQPIVDYATELLGDAVQFSGSMRHVGNALGAMDCHVNISPSEGFGLSTVEAWAAGVPTVTTPTGIVPEATRQHGALAWQVALTGMSGFDARQVSEAIDSATLGSIGFLDRTKRIAREHFSAERMGRRWAEYLGAL